MKLQIVSQTLLLPVDLFVANSSKLSLSLQSAKSNYSDWFGIDFILFSEQLTF